MPSSLKQIKHLHMHNSVAYDPLCLSLFLNLSSEPESNDLI